MKKIRIVVMLSLLSIGAVCGFLKAGYAQTNSKEDYEKLQKRYDALLVDRDNILAQAKSMIEFKNKYRDLEAELKKAQDEKSKVQTEEQVLKQQVVDLQQKLADMQSAFDNQIKESADLKKSLEKMMIDYKVVPETKKELSSVKNDNASLRRNIQQLEGRVKNVSQQKMNDDAQMEIYRMQIKDLKKQYQEALVRNRTLEKKAEQVPQRFAEIARENKTLIKETALMHYNLGVFYAKNKEHIRATAEFEKAAELNPDDPATFYNLGYIHAEYLVNRPKAIEYFRKYLSLVKTDDKDVDWVKKYILTWQTWEGKKPMN